MTHETGVRGVLVRSRERCVQKGVGAFPMDTVGRRGDGAFSLFMIGERMAVCSSEIT